MVSVLPPLPRDLCKEGLSLSLLAFALTGSVAFELPNYTVDEDCCESGSMLIQKLGAS